MTNYSIDTGDGNTISAGLPANLARGCAQEAADRLGRSVWLLDGSEGEDDVGEEIVDGASVGRARVPPCDRGVPRPSAPDLTPDLTPEEHNQRVLGYQRALDKWAGA